MQRLTLAALERLFAEVLSGLDGANFPRHDLKMLDAIPAIEKAAVQVGNAFEEVWMNQVLERLLVSTSVRFVEEVDPTN
jgi:hypothetical protein